MSFNDPYATEAGGRTWCVSCGDELPEEHEDERCWCCAPIDEPEDLEEQSDAMQTFLDAHHAALAHAEAERKKLS